MVLTPTTKIPLGFKAPYFELLNPLTGAPGFKLKNVYERFGIGLDATKGLLRWFHNSAAKTLVNTKSHREDRTSDGFTALFLCHGASLGACGFISFEVFSIQIISLVAPPVTMSLHGKHPEIIFEVLPREHIVTSAGIYL